MTGQRKAAHEQAVFAEFAAAAGLALGAGSIQSRPEPEPDIMCAIDNNPYRFELGRLVDENTSTGFVRSMQDALHGIRSFVGGAFSYDRPLQKMLKAKIGNTYTTNGDALDLLLYYDAELPTRVHPPPGDFDEWATRYALPIVQTGMGPFSRVWIFDRNGKRVLWRHP